MKLSTHGKLPPSFAFRAVLASTTKVKIGLCSLLLLFEGRASKSRCGLCPGRTKSRGGCSIWDPRNQPRTAQRGVDIVDALPNTYKRKDARVGTWAWLGRRRYLYLYHGRYVPINIHGHGGFHLLYVSNWLLQTYRGNQINLWAVSQHSYSPVKG